MSLRNSGFPNKEQRAIIDHLEGPLLVLAPAGTGKSRVMAARLASALESGIHPERTLALTFTTRACTEIRHKATATLGDKASQARIFTFHALCAWILRWEAEDLGFSPDFVVYDELDSCELLSDLGCPYDPEKFFWDLSQRKSGCPNTVLTISGVPRLFPDNSACQAVVEGYQRLLEEQNALDFGDLVHRVRAMLHLLPEKGVHWGNRFDWVQVDEVQDTHFSEYDVVSYLARRTGNLALFGDVDQTIYQWRGSDPDDVLQRFYRDFRSVRVLKLSRSYRATRKLVKAADRFAGCFETRRTRLVPDRSLDRGEKIIVRECGSDEEEARWVAQAARRLHEGNAGGGRIAILARSNTRAQRLAEALRLAGVSHVTVEAFDFFRRQEIKDALARLRLIINPADSCALQRSAIRPRVGIGEVTLRRIRDEGYPVRLRLVDLAMLRTHETGEPFTSLLGAWSSGDVVFVDVESTGLSPHQDEVIEVAALRFHAGQLSSEFHRYLRPTLSVGDSERLHGCSDAFLREHGSDPCTVFQEFKAFAANAHVVGHNIRFDLQLLESHAKRVGVDLRADRWDDTLVLSQRILRTERYDLGTLQRFLGLNRQPTHRALDDVYCTAELLRILMRDIEQGHLERSRIVTEYGGPFRLLAEMLASWRKQAGTMRPPDLLQKTIEESGLSTYYSSDPRRMGNLEGLVRFFQISDQGSTHPLTALQSITGKASLARNVDHLDPNDNRIPIMTVHQAKGLEFDTVFVAGLVEGEFPNFYSVKAGLLDEERRLFYVAITRPRRRLLLSWHVKNESGRVRKSSPFLEGLRWRR